MCLASAEAAFGWASFILVNVAFVCLVSWGASTAWLIGFGACTVYTILLFVLAYCLDHRGSGGTTNVDDGESRYNSIQSPSESVNASSGIENDHVQSQKNTVLFHEDPPNSHVRMLFSPSS